MRWWKIPTAGVIRAAISKLTDVQRLVHLAMRLTDPDVEEVYKFLFDRGRRKYEETLNQMAEQIGCPGLKARLTNPVVLSELSLLYRAHATSIVATYNYDLVGALEDIYEQNPRSNRHAYAKHIRGWENSRKDWKSPQIALMTAQYAQNLAVSHFAIYNQFYIGYGTFDGPDDELTCEICQELLARNPYSLLHFNYLDVPVHVNCRHKKTLHVRKATPEQCQRLWMGQQMFAGFEEPELPKIDLLEGVDTTGIEDLNWLDQFERCGIINWPELLIVGKGCHHPKSHKSEGHSCF